VAPLPKVIQLLTAIHELILRAILMSGLMEGLKRDEIGRFRPSKAIS